MGQKCNMWHFEKNHNVIYNFFIWPYLYILCKDFGIIEDKT